MNGSIDFMSKPLLQSEFEYYLAHQDDLVAKYRGRFIVIKDCKVIGDYSSELEAVTEASKSHKMGTFLVQHCEPGEESTTQVFHSQVAFC